MGLLVSSDKRVSLEDVAGGRNTPSTSPAWIAIGSKLLNSLNATHIWNDY